ncbi:TonB family protein [Hymenobacter sp. 102]|uniref:TonB family protein n=1 Tax=Hymenobacter sp. 102 TaxID=3403152 RepID=UPI003CED795F
MRTLFFLLIGLSTPAFAQQPGQTLTAYFQTQPHQTTLGFGSGVLFRTDTVRAATGAGGTVKKYYPSGQVYEQYEYADFKKRVLSGPHTRWYETGQVQLSEQYRENELHGELTTYYPGGAVKRRSLYQQGKQKKASSNAPDGTGQATPELLVYPEYPGGLLTLLTDIQRRTTYPQPLIRQGVTGKVQVAFVVDAQGRIRQARIRESVHPELDAEALRVVNSLQGWTPGRLDGEPVDVLFGLPVTFTIR